ncbi:MAG: hypothetical protein ACK559_24745, partial [bacterium]
VRLGHLLAHDRVLRLRATQPEALQAPYPVRRVDEDMLALWAGCSFGCRPDRSHVDDPVCSRPSCLQWRGFLLAGWFGIRSYSALFLLGLGYPSCPWCRIRGQREQGAVDRVQLPPCRRHVFYSLDATAHVLCQIPLSEHLHQRQRWGRLVVSLLEEPALRPECAVVLALAVEIQPPPVAH